MQRQTGRIQEPGDCPETVVLPASLPAQIEECSHKRGQTARGQNARSLHKVLRTEQVGGCSSSDCQMFRWTKVHVELELQNVTQFEDGQEHA